MERGTVNTTDAGRLAAYADLVAAVLDLRAPSPTEHFDEALAEAVRNGEISDDVARRLRWLQRQSCRSIVEHAETVLPAALLALDHSLSTTASHAYEDQPRSSSPAPSPDAAADDDPADVVNLQSRRLLVAGLRPISGPAPDRGPLPSAPADPGF
jgi:hypothetical protein